MYRSNLLVVCRQCAWSLAWNQYVHVDSTGAAAIARPTTPEALLDQTEQLGYIESDVFSAA
jgi:hypothetical protein